MKFLDSIYYVPSIMISAFYVLFPLTIIETLWTWQFRVLLITEEEIRGVTGSMGPRHFRRDRTVCSVSVWTPLLIPH